MSDLYPSPMAAREGRLMAGRHLEPALPAEVLLTGVIGAGFGSPESVVSASASPNMLRNWVCLDGDDNTTRWWKASGEGTTGWVALPLSEGAAAALRAAATGRWHETGPLMDKASDPVDRDYLVILKDWDPSTS